MKENAENPTPHVTHNGLIYCATRLQRCDFLGANIVKCLYHGNLQLKAKLKPGIFPPFRHSR